MSGYLYNPPNKSGTDSRRQFSGIKAVDKEVAEYVGLHQHIREMLTAVHGAGIQAIIAPRRRWRPGDLGG
jgi:hypothetical protein